MIQSVESSGAARESMATLVAESLKVASDLERLSVRLCESITGPESKQSDDKNPRVREETHARLYKFVRGVVRQVLEQ